MGAKKAVGHIVSNTGANWDPRELNPASDAIACSETSVQPHLPQVFLGAKRSMPAAATLVEHPQIQICGGTPHGTQLLQCCNGLICWQGKPILLLDMAPWLEPGHC